MTVPWLGSLSFVSVVATLLLGCATSGEPPASKAASAPQAGLIEAKDRLLADVRRCSEQHGYYPKQVSGIAQNALAPGELQWRQCAYDAARRYVGQNPQMRGLYEQLIAEDIELTTAIQLGTATRTQRRARDDELLAQIQAAEQAQIKDLAGESERQDEQVRQLVDGLRGLGP